MSNNISIKSINDLLKNNFFIPSYQRGYRWTVQQVTDLLNDIWAFINKPNKNDEEWYCLQPVVATKLSDEKIAQNKLDKNENWYEVIDGQQRLTTISLVLKKLENFVESERINFQIVYETKDSKTFIAEINNKSEEESEKNIDYFHLYNAYQAILKWFQEKAKQGHSSISSKFITPFLEKVRIIWYETTSNDSIEIFTRINSGKIPLTNAELIKALFLNTSNFQGSDSEKIRLKQLEIASEWDRMEYALQDDTFWYFINEKQNNLPTRIEFIFSLMQEQTSESDQTSKSEYSTFLFFYEKFKTPSEQLLNNEWIEVKKCFQTIEEWFQDRELYHKIGYLIAMGTQIKDILTEKQEKTKTEFNTWIVEKIKEKIKNVQLEDLEYGYGIVRNILLLHNTQTLLRSKNETTKFPFDRYKKEKWDIEHIHAVATEVKVEKEKQKEWLENNFVKTEKHNDDRKNNIIEEIKSGKTVEENVFNEIIYYVLGEEDNSLRNLCLLNSSTNRSYKNASFKAKRKEIIEREKEGTFIPICTRNVFLKYYSSDANSLDLWNEEDKEKYLEDIKSVLKEYLN